MWTFTYDNMVQKMLFWRNSMSTSLTSVLLNACKVFLVTIPEFVVKCFSLYHPQRLRNRLSEMLQKVNLAISGCI